MWSTILNLFIYFLIMTILNYLRHLTLNYNITLTANLNPSNDQYTSGPYIFKHMLPPHHHVLDTLCHNDVLIFLTHVVSV
jgi:hypothetical protein